MASKCTKGLVFGDDELKVFSYLDDVASASSPRGHAKELALAESFCPFAGFMSIS